MIRCMTTAAAGTALAAALALLPPAGRAVAQPTPDAVSPPQLTPPPNANRKPHNGGRHAAAVDTVMRGGDTPGLIAMLPWWRPDDWRPPGSDPGELESPILTACDVWLGFPFATADAQSLTVRLSEAQHASEIDLVADKIRVADPAELNEIDLGAPAEPQSGGRPWLRGLLALLGGALAVFSALRYLVA
jgi:hypothetical protein